jgi:sugar (pentulose or hexulose) kinase
MSVPPCLIVVDLGTQSLRVSVVGLDGKRLWSWQQAVSTIQDGERQEQDPAEWRALMGEGLAAAAQEGYIPLALLASAPLAGWVPLSGAGTALALATMYNDSRSEADLPWVEAALEPGVAVPRITIADPLPHALMLRREEPRTYAAMRSLVDATGWLNFLLTGEIVLNKYTAIRLYSDTIRRRLGLSAARFGRVVEIGEVIGPLIPSLAERLAWPAVPVIAATFDSKCAYLGSGVGAPGEALDISGTVTSFGVVSSEPVVDPLDRIYSVPFMDGHLVRGSTAAAGSIIEWVRKLLGLTVSELDALVVQGALSADDPILLPYHSGARAPLWKPRARGVISGLSIATSREELARSVYAGLGLSLRHIVDTIEANGVQVDTILLSGGLARSAVLSQCKADILGRPVTVLGETELTTFGLAAIGATALGRFPNVRAAARQFVRPAQTFTPKLSAEEAGRLFHRYRTVADLSGELISPRNI